MNLSEFYLELSANIQNYREGCITRDHADALIRKLVQKVPHLDVRIDLDEVLDLIDIENDSSSYSSYC